MLTSQEGGWSSHRRRGMSVIDKLRRATGDNHVVTATAAASAVARRLQEVAGGLLRGIVALLRPTARGGATGLEINQVLGVTKTIEVIDRAQSPSHTT